LRVNDFANGAGVSVAVLKFRAYVFFLGHSDITLYFLSEKAISIPMKLILCLEGSFVPTVASFIICLISRVI
jgi:hypothetical protein